MKLIVASLLTSLLAVCFVSGCNTFASSETGSVWTIPHPQFRELSAQHELVAVMPISIDFDLKKDTGDSGNSTHRENADGYIGDLQRFPNAELMHGVQEGRITVRVQNVEETIKLLDQEVENKER